MTESTPARRRASLFRLWSVARAVLLAVIAATGLLLITDRPGLETDYVALDKPWQGDPVDSAVGEPKLEHVLDVRDILMSSVGFGIRWTGAWYVEQRGDHRFTLDANDLGYLRIDGQLVADTGGVFGDPVDGSVMVLEPGFHRLEAGVFQKDGESRFSIQWTAPDSATTGQFPGSDLYSGWPLGARRALREALSSWPRPCRQVLGLGLLLVVILVLLPALRFGGGHNTPIGPRWRAALLLALFVVTFAASLPFTGSLRGGDDTAYLSAATFGTGGWFANRYGHVYLLKLFTLLSGGDPLTGVRVWWAFAFAATVAALAVAVRSIGPGLQLRTLGVTLFLLLSQTTMMGLIGNGFADFSSMMFVTVAVAAYMHGFLRRPDRAPPRHEWHALAIGALTVGAMRSKEVGAVLLLLPLLFLWVDGRLDLRQFLRRMAYWALGVVAALPIVVLLDGLIFGNYMLTLGRGRMGTLGQMNFPAGRAPRPNADWLRTIWTGREVDLSLRFVWLGACVAALVAGIRRCRLELRLLHLLPIAYLVALIVLYIRLPHPFSPRMLITILPVACLMTALLLHYAGLDELPWRRLLAPGVLIPSGLLAALVVFLLIPLRVGSLAAGDFLPAAKLERFGWTPEHFTTGVLLPVAVLAASGILAISVGQRPNRVAALLVLTLALFGSGFAITRAGLAGHHSVQVSDLLAYPWRTFDSELREAPAQTVWLSRDLLTHNRMTAQTRSALARLALGRLDVWVKLTREFPAGSDTVIASRRAWLRWRQGMSPALERALTASARWDPQEIIVLLRPAEAGKLAERLDEVAVAGAQVTGAGLATLSDLPGRLSALTERREPEARERLLQAILASQAVKLHSIQGARILAVGISADGWTTGDQAAGLIVTNGGSAPLIAKIRLGVAASVDSVYPIRALVDDGVRQETVVFDRPGRQEVELSPLPAGTSRLVVVRADRAWSPGGRDTRELGVQVLPADGSD